MQAKKKKNYKHFTESVQLNMHILGDFPTQLEGCTTAQWHSIYPPKQHSGQDVYYWHGLGVVVPPMTTKATQDKKPSFHNSSCRVCLHHYLSYRAAPCKPHLQLVPPDVARKGPKHFEVTGSHWSRVSLYSACAKYLNPVK